MLPLPDRLPQPEVGPGHPDAELDLVPFFLLLLDAAAQTTAAEMHVSR